jgi:DGQHR domain-containing protein
VGKKQSTTTVTVPALKVTQWLPEWEDVTFDEKRFQSRPEPSFLLLSLRSSYLKALTGVYRRVARHGSPRAKDPNVQRGHEEERSRTIREFVKYGFPWCEMGEANRAAPDAESLRKPGWLPGAIIINILEEGAERNGVRIGKSDLVVVEGDSDTATVHLPAGFEGPPWEPVTIFPLEVIDGQHRLWAFEDFDPGQDFQLPVVAFHGLDRSWQAYLFWSVNITPKRINRSLAFDLYPLLRKETWLEKFAGHSIYRETRCQELVEALWSHPQSPWRERINMLGETAKQLESKTPMVTQAAWIRSLMASFVKEWPEEGTRIGGLFGAGRGEDELVLPWNRAMQVAFLIYAGREVQKAVEKTKAKWALHLRSLKEEELFDDDDPAFYGQFSLLTTDQGIRGLLQVTNDLCYVSSDRLGLVDWNWDAISSQQQTNDAAATDEGAVDLAVKSLSKSKIGAFLADLGQALSTYDWRTASTPNLSDAERLQQGVFRGSSGYKEMRRRLLLHLTPGNGELPKAAKKVMEKLDYK